MKYSPVIEAIIEKWSATVYDDADDPDKPSKTKIVVNNDIRVLLDEIDRLNNLLKAVHVDSRK